MCISHRIIHTHATVYPKIGGEGGIDWQKDKSVKQKRANNFICTMCVEEIKSSFSLIGNLNWHLLDLHTSEYKL